MQRNSFILGVALVVVATTVAVTITVSNPTGADTPSSENSPASAGSSDASLPRNPVSSSPGSLSRTASRSPRRATREPEVLTVTAPLDHPDSALLVQKAQQVEAEAQKQLARLTEQLELTREQRRRLFPILARASQNYGPAMIISGLPAGASPLSGPAGNEALTNLLEPPQKDQLVEDAMSDIALWQEIIAKLRRRLDEQTPEVKPPQVPPAPSTDPAAREPVPAAPRGRANLFDQIHPQRSN